MASMGRGGRVNENPVHDSPLASIADSTHVYCPVCDAVQPLALETSAELDADSEASDATDLVCAACDFVVATLYRAQHRTRPDA